MTRPLSLITAAILIPSTAQAWEHLGYAWHPDDIPLEYSIADYDERPSFADEAIFAAYEAWEEGAPCAELQTEFLGHTMGNIPRTNDGKNHISFDDPGDHIGAGTLAIMQPFLGEPLFVQDGRTYFRFTNADIVFNDNVLWEDDANIEAGTCNGGNSMQATATHEVGHQWGLGHSCERDDICADQDLQDATMYWSGAACDTSRSTINIDDTEGITALYGPFATFTCSHQLDPDDSDSLAVGVVPFTLRCALDSDYIDQIDEVQWFFGDGGTAEGVHQVEHTYEQPGSYTVRVQIEGYNEVCGDWGYDYRRLGYVRACGLPDVEFTYEHINGLTYQLLNETDLSVHGCIFDVAWDIFDANDEKVGSLRAWEPQFTFPEAGEYRVVLNVGGIAGTSAAELVVDAVNKRGEGYGCATAGTAGLGGFAALIGGLLGATALRRRRK